MKLDSGGASPAHLTYCSNIHPGESWSEVSRALADHVPRIREHLNLTDRFGLGLRLSARAARALRAPDALREFRDWMQAEDAYVFTLNGFPYGPFHGTPVKEAVYRPDWSTPERLTYTEDLVEVLAALLPPGTHGSISTVPGAFRNDPSANDPAQLVEGLLRSAHRCWQKAQDDGLDICIALEPEPMCLLETTEETVDFFQEHILHPSAIARFSKLARCSTPQAEQALRKHLGVCVDTCHAAVEFEDPGTVASQLSGAGIRVAKVQVTAGLELGAATPEAVEHLAPFVEDTYLHQVVIAGPNGLVRLLDLPEAIERWRAGALPDGRWRVHLHVPVFAQLAPPLRSTASFVKEALPGLRSICDHFEVETYTWSVLPASLRERPLAASIAEELLWTRNTWESV